MQVQLTSLLFPLRPDAQFLMPLTPTISKPRSFSDICTSFLGAVIKSLSISLGCKQCSSPETHLRPLK